MGEGGPPAPRFCADRNLGRLARWLRLLGYDTLWLSASTPASLLECRTTGRTVLTRHERLRGLPGVVFIAQNDPKEQLAALATELGLTAEPRLSRCSLCNAELEPASPEEVEGRLPEHVRLTQRDFRRCPACRRLYWPGTHVERMRHYLKPES